jgi:hypothetical protein
MWDVTKIKRKKLFCRRPKRNKRRRKKIEESQCAWDQIKEKKNGKVGREKEGSEGRGIIFDLLFLSIAAPYKKGAFLL